MKWMTLVFLGSLNQAVAAPELEPFPQIASERGWDVVASHLEEVVNSAKNDKKRDKALEEQQFHKLSMPVTFFAGADLVFQQATPAGNCTWGDTVTCTFQTEAKTDLVPTAYRALCRTHFSSSPVLKFKTKTLSNGQWQWHISNVEACWALDGQSIVIGPVTDDALDGVGAGDDFNPPELVELSWRETEEIIRNKSPIFRYCARDLPEDHPARSGRLEVKYHIGETGRIDKAEIERATFTDPELTGCVLERFKRIHIRPPMGGWTGGVYILTFAR